MIADDENDDDEDEDNDDDNDKSNGETSCNRVEQVKHPTTTMSSKWGSAPKASFVSG